MPALFKLTRREQAFLDKQKALKKLNATEPPKGLWKLQTNIQKRAVILTRGDSASRHLVYYGTRTGRTLEEAMLQAKALQTVANVLKSKTI